MLAKHSQKTILQNLNKNNTSSTTLIGFLFRLFNKEKPLPHFAQYPLWLLIWKPFRKFINVVLIPNTPLNGLRIVLYKSLGYKIGKGVFIGMKCYLDDLDPSHLTIKDKVTISYGCYFTLHGKRQEHQKITIEENTYIGMRCNIIAAKKDITIGKNCVVGAGSLVNKSIANGLIVAGVPAKEIGKA